MEFKYVYVAKNMNNNPNNKTIRDITGSSIIFVSDLIEYNPIISEMRNKTNPDAMKSHIRGISFNFNFILMMLSEMMNVEMAEVTTAIMLIVKYMYVSFIFFSPHHKATNSFLKTPDMRR